jgi:hypothetical protein
MAQNLSGQSSAASKYTHIRTLIPKRTTSPSMDVAPYFSRSQAHTYATDTTKNKIVQATNTMSCIPVTPKRRPAASGALFLTA